MRALIQPLVRDGTGSFSCLGITETQAKKEYRVSPGTKAVTFANVGLIRGEKLNCFVHTLLQRI